MAADSPSRAGAAARQRLTPAAWSASTPSWSITALFFLVPLYVMVVTSLKTMPEIRSGNLLAPARRPDASRPGCTAWLSACTGLSCNGISVGFFNSVKILMPSVIVSIAGRVR